MCKQSTTNWSYVRGFRNGYSLFTNSPTITRRKESKKREMHVLCKGLHVHRRNHELRLFQFPNMFSFQMMNIHIFIYIIQHIDSCCSVEWILCIHFSHFLLFVSCCWKRIDIIWVQSGLDIQFASSLHQWVYWNYIFCSVSTFSSYSVPIIQRKKHSVFSYSFSRFFLQNSSENFF